MRGGAGERLSRRGRRLEPWLTLAAVVGVLWAVLPVGPRLGAAVLGTRLGAWSAGWGLVVAVGALALVLGHRVSRPTPRPLAVVGASAVVAGWASALLLLPGKPVERVHLLEYAVVGWLAWRALRGVVGDGARTLVLAVVLAALLGWGDELLQLVVPGRYYDPRDVLMNGIGGALGVATAALLRWPAGAVVSGG